jgi:hypothetical protein
VKWVLNIAAIICLAVWLPVTMHCTLETLPGFAFFEDCCGEEAPPLDDCCEDVCSTLESGLYKIEDNPGIEPDLKGYLPLADWGLLIKSASSAAARSAPLSTAPPEITASWQFALRTALSARPPSVTS